MIITKEKDVETCTHHQTWKWNGSKVEWFLAIIELRGGSMCAYNELVKLVPGFWYEHRCFATNFPKKTTGTPLIMCDGNDSSGMLQ